MPDFDAIWAAKYQAVLSWLRSSQDVAQWLRAQVGRGGTKFDVSEHFAVKTANWPPAPHAVALARAHADKPERAVGVLLGLRTHYETVRLAWLMDADATRRNRTLHEASIPMPSEEVRRFQHALINASFAFQSKPASHTELIAEGAMWASLMANTPLFVTNVLSLKTDSLTKYALTDTVSFHSVGSELQRWLGVGSVIYLPISNGGRAEAVLSFFSPLPFSTCGAQAYCTIPPPPWFDDFCRELFPPHELALLRYADAAFRAGVERTARSILARMRYRRERARDFIASLEQELANLKLSPAQVSAASSALQHTVSNLVDNPHELLMGFLDSLQRPEPDRVSNTDINALLRYLQASNPFLQRGPRRNQRLVFDRSIAAQTQTPVALPKRDLVQVAAAVTNGFIRNAEKHSTSKIAVNAVPDGDQIRLSITNTAPYTDALLRRYATVRQGGLPLPDFSGSQHGTGGLGIFLAREVTRRIGAELRVDVPIPDETKSTCEWTASLELPFGPETNT